MANEISQDGVGLISVQDVENSTINITQQIGKSARYGELIEQLNTQNDLLSYIPEGEIEKRISVSAKIAVLEETIEQFKQDVIKLAKEFSRIEINTERLKQAKELFENGEFDESRLVLEGEFKELIKEQEELLNRREEYEQEILPKLKHSAEEFLILALSKQFDYNNPNRFIEVNECFESSLKSFLSKDNLYLYATYLQEHNQFSKSAEMYDLLVKDFLEEFAPVDKATIFNNFAVLHKDWKSYESAAELNSKALNIYRELVRENPELYLSYLGNTLNNLGLLYNDIKEYETALPYYEEALAIRRDIVLSNPIYLPNLAKTLNNVGLLFYNQNEHSKSLPYFIEAIDIYRKLVESNAFYLPDLAMTLDNLGHLYNCQEKGNLAKSVYEESHSIYEKLAEQNPHKFLHFLAIAISNLSQFESNETALTKLQEVLQIRRSLASENPQTYLPDVASTLDNLAIVYSRQQEYDEAIATSDEALKIYRELREDNEGFYLPEIASTLNDLANIHIHKDELETASNLLEEALEIRLNLYESNPKIYQIDLAQTLYTLAVFYQDSITHREKSIEYAKEAIKILLPIVDEIPYVNQYLQFTFNILKKWGLDRNTIQQIIDKYSIK